VRELLNISFMNSSVMTIVLASEVGVLAGRW
jgi:hypothetical protein